MKAKIKEIELQKKLKLFCSNPSTRFTTESGKYLQILSLGDLNVHDGPDFLNAAILLEGKIIVGDIEYHVNENDWYNHGHDNDRNYGNVILHIVSKMSNTQNTGIETLFVEENKLRAVKTTSSTSSTPESYEDIQHFALVRLLRKASEANRLLLEHGFEQALINQLRLFIDRYSSRQRRPVYSEDKLQALPKNIANSDARTMLNKVQNNEEIDVVSELQQLIQNSMLNVGDHLRREIVLNCILPIAICLAEDNCRLDIFVWFWSVKSLHPYGVLKRKYPDYSQEYLWQQQGLLEYQRLYGNKKNIVREAIRDYGFAKVLDFYRFGSTDFEDIYENNRNQNDEESDINELLDE